MINYFWLTANPKQENDYWTFSEMSIGDVEIWHALCKKNDKCLISNAKYANPKDRIIGYEIKIKEKTETREVVALLEIEKGVHTAEYNEMKSEKNKEYLGKKVFSIKLIERFEKPVSIDEILKEYPEFKNSNPIKSPQTTLNKLKPDEFKKIEKIIKSKINQETPKAIDISEPTERTEYTISRIIRDTKISNGLKALYSNKCQVCEKTITLKNGDNYSEAHHIKPLGKDHNGPDIEGNIIVLCPNHHVEFDYGVMAIHPDTKIICHKDCKNEYNGDKLKNIKHELNYECLKYHYEQFSR